MKLRFKKLTSITLVLIMLFTALTVISMTKAAADSPEFALSEVSGKAGDEVEVYLSISNNPGITALSVRVGYSADSLELVSIANVGLFDDGISTSKLTMNPVTISWYAGDSADKKDSGDLAVLTFRIKENASTSELKLSYDEDNVFDSGFNNIKFKTVNGKVTIGGGSVTPVPATAAPTVKPTTAVDTTAPCFVLGTVSGEAGDEVEVPLSVLNNPGITALSVRIEYSSNDLELLGIESAGLFEDGISSSKLTANPLTVSWYAGDSADHSDSGKLAVLRFRINENAKTSELKLSYDKDNVFDSGFNNKSFEMINGKVLIGTDASVPATMNPNTQPSGSKHILGDTDQDGEVTILDATAIQRYLAGLPTNADGIGETIE